MSVADKFVAPGFLVFLDILITSFTNWIYWLIISKLASTSEIGEATTVFSLVLLLSLTIQLGLEYPILRQSVKEKSQILGTAVSVQLFLSLIAVPALIYFLSVMIVHPTTLLSFSWVAIGILITNSLSFVARYILLGIFGARSVLIIDVAATCLRFASGYVLVQLGFGAIGILISFLLYGILHTGIMLTVLIRVSGFVFRIGSLKFVKEIVKEGLVNTPFKLSKALVGSLSVILLTPLGVSSSDVGIFYISLMISIIATSLASSIALMGIPASSMKGEFSPTGIRIGLSLTTPIITALLVAPGSILSLIGPQYTLAQIALVILSVGILPSAITFSAISILNSKNKQRKIIFIGTVEVVSFLLVFVTLVPYYGINGAAFSILVGFVVSAIPSIFWLGREFLKYVVICIIAIAVGYLVGYVIGFLIAAYPVAQILSCIIVTLIVTIILKNMSLTEILAIARTAMGKS